MDVNERVLNGLRGRLGIEVSHPNWAGALRVVGASNDTVDYGWSKMPDGMRTRGRLTYACEADWSGDLMFVFDDEVEVVDAPAHMVVDAMMDRIAMFSPATADRLWFGEDGEDEEDEEDGEDEE